MALESLDLAIEQFFFWAGVVVGSLALIYLFTVEANRKGVFQSQHGVKSLQSDKSVGAAIIAVVSSIISITASLGYVGWGFLACFGFIGFTILIDEAYWRAFSKTIGSMIRNFFNKLEAIFQGKNRKEG